MQWTRPKSVRQIGEIPGRGRIYMEDYVIRFVKRLAEQSHGMEKAAVLLGTSLICDGEKIYQISGVVEIHNFAGRSGPKFTDEDWDYIYSEMKENFTDLEIVGWFYSCQGFSVNQAGQLLQMHKLNFEKRDKVLYLYDETDGEDSFFLYRSGQLEKQKGYYIYYEKNPEMLHYMERENNRHVHIVEQEDDRVVRNICGIMEEKEKFRTKKKQKEVHMGYGIAAVTALIVVFAFVVLMQNQSALNQVKQQLNTIQTMNRSRPANQDKTIVETQKAKLTPCPSTVPPTQENTSVPSVSPTPVPSAPAQNGVAQ